MSDEWVETDDLAPFEAEYLLLHVRRLLAKWQQSRYDGESHHDIIKRNRAAEQIATHGRLIAKLEAIAGRVTEAGEG